MADPNEPERELTPDAASAALSAFVARKTAGDLFIAAADKWASHAEVCVLDECPDCDALINQFRLARKIWQVSAHKREGING